MKEFIKGLNQNELNSLLLVCTESKKNNISIEQLTTIVALETRERVKKLYDTKQTKQKFVKKEYDI